MRSLQHCKTSYVDSANKSNTEITLELSYRKEEVEVLTRGLEEEVEALGQALKEGKAAEKSYLKELVHMATLKENACRDTMEAYEAYEACKILQVEIDLLRKQASERNENRSQNDYTSTSSDASENWQQPWRSLSYSHDRSSSISSLVFHSVP